MTADQAVTKTRCTKCGASVRAGSQIIYVGSSAFAMSGSRTAQDSEESGDTNLEQWSKIKQLNGNFTFDIRKHFETYMSEINFW